MKYIRKVPRSLAGALLGVAVICGILVVPAATAAPALTELAAGSDVVSASIKTDAVKESRCQKSFNNPKFKRACKCLKTCVHRSYVSKDTDENRENTIWADKQAYRARNNCCETDLRPAMRSGQPGTGAIVRFHDCRLSRVVHPDSLEEHGFELSTNPSDVPEDIWTDLHTKGDKPLITAKRAIKYCARQQCTA